MKATLKQIDAFKADLRDVLSKHNASLDYMVDGDTHGIFDTGIGVSFGNGVSRWTETVRLGDGGCDSIDAGDL